MDIEGDIQSPSPEGEQALRDALSLISAWRGGPTVYLAERSRVLSGHGELAATEALSALTYLVDALSSVAGGALMILENTAGISPDVFMKAVETVFLEGRPSGGAPQ